MNDPQSPPEPGLAAFAADRHRLPERPRSLAGHEVRACGLLMGLGVLLLFGITVLDPLLAAEDALGKRRRDVWSTGVSAVGTVVSREEARFLPRKSVRIAYEVDGQMHHCERLVVRVDDFADLAVGSVVNLQVDPADPAFAVLDLDVRAGLADLVPTSWLVAAVLTIAGGITFLGFRRWHLLVHGEEIPCVLDPGPGATRCRATYLVEGTTHTRLVEGEFRGPGSVGVLLVDRRWPRWPILGLVDSFRGAASTEMGGRDLLRRWLSSLVPASIGAWVAWGVLSLLVGEAVPAVVRTAMTLVVAVAVLAVSRPRPAEEPPP